MTSTVSAIVLTKNSQEFLWECLDNLRDQTYPNIELLVIDNFSKDDTEKIATHFADVYAQKGPERVTQANYGIRLARGEYIYLTGSDLCRDSNLVAECVKKLDEGYDAVRMSVKTDKRVKHFWGKVKALERECYIGTFIESARFFKKEAWDFLGRFDEDIIGMEEDFQHRLDEAGFKTAWINSYEYHLHEDDTLAKIFKKAFYYGGYMRAYLSKNKARGFKQLNPMRPNLKIFLKHPVLLLGFIIYKVVQYTGGIMGMIKCER